jgi:hypothetical protein
MEMAMGPIDCGSEVTLKAKHRDLLPEFHGFLGMRSLIEIKSVEEGLRPCGYSLIGDLTLAEFLMNLEKKGLEYALVLRAKMNRGFLHGYKPPVPGEENLTGVAFGKRKEEVLALKKAFLAHDHLTVGELLGYPECCTQYFASKASLDYTREYLPFEVQPYLTFSFFKFFGASFILHFPCSPFCEPSILLAKGYSELISKEIREFFRAQTPVKISVGRSGILHLETPYIQGGATISPGEEQEVRIELI